MQFSKRACSQTHTSFLTRKITKKEENSRGGTKGHREPRPHYRPETSMCLTISSVPKGSAFCGCLVPVSLLYIGCRGGVDNMLF